MRWLLHKFRSTSLPALLIIIAIFALGMAMWWLGPAEGDKYSDLGINLGIGAAIGVALLYVERLVARGEKARERRLAEEHAFVQSLVAATDLTEVNARGRNFSGILLSSRTLVGGDLSLTSLDRTDFRGADLTRANLAGSRGEGLNLHGAVVDHLRANDVRWPNANLSRVSGSEVDLTGAILLDANITEARLPQTTLDQTELHRANLQRADLSYSKGLSASFEGADLRAANLRCARLVKPIFRDVDLRAADLRDATLTEPDLRGADLRDARVDGLHLRDPLTDERTRLPAIPDRLA